jgi:CRP/FNR family transcriptional regulator
MLIEEVLKRRFPAFAEDGLIEEIVAKAQLRTCRAGDVIIEPGSAIRFVPLIVFGSIKIMRVEPNGSEVYLYHLSMGQTCALSLTCCMGNKPSEVKAVAEEDCEFLALPVNLIEEWAGRYKSWNIFMLNTYQARFDELLQTLDSIAFSKLDQRIAEYLKKQSVALKTKRIETTHQQIAVELGSTREAVSRLLKQMENKGLVALGRNAIELQPALFE